MEIVQQALSESPLHCIKFYGITILPEIGDLKSETLCLVFERATEGTLANYIESGKPLNWNQLISLFEGIGTGLENGLHRKRIVHM